MEQKEIITRGGVYLAKLDPAKGLEVGKMRPVVVLSAQEILDILPPTIFICPLSSQSQPTFAALHIEILSRDNLHAKCYALVEHCRAISIKRINFPRLAQLSVEEVQLILHRLQRLVGL